MGEYMMVHGEKGYLDSWEASSLKSVVDIVHLCKEPLHKKPEPTECDWASQVSCLKA